MPSLDTGEACEPCQRHPLILRPPHPSWAHYTHEQGNLLRWEAILHETTRPTEHQLDILRQGFAIRRGALTLVDFHDWAAAYKLSVVWSREHISVERDGTKIWQPPGREILTDGASIDPMDLPGV